MPAHPGKKKPARKKGGRKRRRRGNATILGLAGNVISRSSRVQGIFHRKA